MADLSPQSASHARGAAPLPRLPGAAWLDVLVLAAVAAVLYLVANGDHSLIERDESGYVARSQQMWQGGNWLVPELLGEKFYDKPILVFWVQAPVLGLLGPTTFAARLPAALCGLLAVLAVYALGRRLVTLAAPQAWGVDDPADRENARRLVGLLAAVVFGTSLLTVFLAKWASTDTLLILLTIGQAWLLAEVLLNAPNRLAGPDGRRPWAWAAAANWWRGAGLAVLTALAVLLKGPANLVFLVPMGLALLWAFRPWDELGWRAAAGGQGRSAGRLAGLWPWALVGLLSLAIALPYFIVVGRLSGGAGTQRFFLQQVLQRLVLPDNGHFGPPGYYTLASVITLYPWSVLYIWAVGGPLAHMWKAWRARRAAAKAGTPVVDAAPVPSADGALEPHAPLVRGLDRVTVFLLAWFVPGSLILELLMVTKLVHYLMPGIPAAALLVGWRLADRLARRPADAAGVDLLGDNRHVRRLAFVSTLAPLVILPPVLAVMAWQAQWRAVLGAVVVGAICVWITRRMWRLVYGGQPLAAVFRTAPLMVAGMLVAYGVVLPGFEPLRLEPAVARKIVELTPPGRPVLMAQWGAFSTAFYAQRPAIKVLTWFSAKKGGPTLARLEAALAARDASQPLTVVTDDGTRAMIAADPAFVARYPQLAPDAPGWQSVSGYEHAGVDLMKGWRRTVWLTVLPAAGSGPPAAGR